MHRHPTPKRAPAQLWKPRLHRSHLNRVTPGDTTSRVQPLAGWGGQGNTGAAVASPTIAAGPAHIVQVVEQSVAIWNKTTGALLSQQTLPQLFTSFSTGTSGMFNPSVLYDDQAGRFVIAAQVRDTVNNKSYVDIAVSNSTDPTQGFTSKYQVEVDQGGLYWSDDGKLGYNTDAWVFSGNLVQFAGMGSSTAVIVVLIKSTRAVQSTYLAGGHVIMVPAQMHGSSGTGGPLWFVQTLGAGGSSITVTKMSNVTSATPIFTDYSLATQAYALAGANAKQPGGTIAADDCRALNVEWNNGHLVASFNAGVGNDGVATWVEFSTAGGTPAVVQQGQIRGAAGTSTMYPAISVDADGNMGMQFIQSSVTEYVSMYVTGRFAGDALGVMGAPIRVVPGKATMVNRAGDYSGISLDPSTPRTFWGTNEYGVYPWATFITKFKMLAQPALSGYFWPDKNVSVSFMRDGTWNNGYQSRLFALYDATYLRTTWQDVIKRAFSAWQAVCGLVFSYVSDDGSAANVSGKGQNDPRFGDIRIGTSAAVPQDQTWYPFQTPLGGNISLNSGTACTNTGTGGNDLFSVMLHSIGIAIGLSEIQPEDSVLRSSGPFPNGLYPIDISGAQLLYGPPPSPPPGPPPATLPNVASILAHSDERYLYVISQGYLTFLGRSPTGIEPAAWLALFHGTGGYTEANFVTNLVGSVEYWNAHFGKSAWVTKAYQDLLGRTPSQGEIAGWSASLDGNNPPSQLVQVASALAHSVERYNRVVILNYQAYLHRTPGATTEIPPWQKALSNGYNEAAFLAALLGSGEYWAIQGSTKGGWVAGVYQDIFGRAASAAEIAQWVAQL